MDPHVVHRVAHYVEPLVLGGHAHPLWEGPSVISTHMARDRWQPSRLCSPRPPSGSLSGWALPNSSLETETPPDLHSGHRQEGGHRHTDQREMNDGFPPLSLTYPVPRLPAGEAISR